MSDAARERQNGEQVVAASMEPTALIDSERYLSVNQPYAALFEAESPDQLEAAPWKDWLVQDTQRHFEQVAIPTCRKEGRWQGEIIGRRSDASEISLEMSLATLGDHQFICSARRTETNGRSKIEDERRFEFIEHLFDAIDDIVYVLHDGGQSYYWNQTLAETTGYSHEEIGEMTAMDFLPEDQHQYAPGLIEAIDAIEDRRVELDILTKDGDRIPHEFKGTTFTDTRTGESFRFGIARDISERLQREARLERQRDELETLDRINELILEITRELFQSPNQTDIEQTVCNSLANSELYEFALIASPDTGDGPFRPRVSAGVDNAYAESTLTNGGTDPHEDPARRAFRTGEITVSQDLRSDPTFAGWRPAAVDQEARSAAAVPLVYGETTYGILAVFSSRPLGFSRREQDVFNSLGTAVAFAINAIKNRRLLFSDKIVELEFSVTDQRMVFVQASDRLACEISITGFIESESGYWSVFVSVEGGSPAAVRDIVSDRTTVTDVRVIAAEDDSGLLEVVLSGRALNKLTEYGAILTSARIVDGTGRFCIEAPQTTNIRKLINRLQATYPDSVLVAQREFDRPAKNAKEIRQSLDEHLTDRQWEALKRGYLAGYFDWPRTSSAGDVAEMMDLSETTFHYHLRNGLDTLLGSLVDLDHR